MTVDKIRVRNWRAVEAEAVASGQINPARVAEIAREQLAAVRAHRLAELRKAQGVTQTAVADTLAVSQARISKIERGDLDHSELGTVRSYVEALGGHLRIVADFGDQTITVE